MLFFKNLKNNSKLIIKKAIARHFSSRFKRIEFMLLVLVTLFLFNVMKVTSLSAGIKGIIAEVEALIAIYISFRYLYLGFSVAFLFNFTQVFFIIGLYNSSHNENYLTALTVKVFTIIFSIFVTILSNNQEDQKNKLHTLTITDELTGIFNLRFFHTTLEKEIETAKNNKSSVGLIMADIDNFKMYNDIYGQECGDNILTETAALLKKIVNNDGTLCRYGGDEFVIILSNTDRKTILQIANRIKRDFNSTKNFEDKYNIFNNVTLSMGASEYPYTSSSKDQLITQAGTALYHAKNLGKDSVHFYQDVIQYISKNINSDQQQLIGIFKGLLSTVSAKDKYTLGHCERVSTYAVMIGEALNLPLNEITILQYAGLLHDIGKIELPKSILNKSDHLTNEEFSFIEQHPVISANILEPLEGMNLLTEHVKHHHERYDGKGYPDGLSGENISLGARILCVADSFDAMLSDRPYSKSMSLEDALKELKRCSGTQFDPKIADTFVRIIEEKLIPSKKEVETPVKTSV